MDVLSARPATAAAKRKAAAPKAKPKPKPGWVLDRVRFESLDATGKSGALAVDQVGEYRGAIEVVRSDSGVAVVNDVGLEDYVRGISEVPSTWPAEALKAQAIAARTYALYDAAGTTPTATRAVGAHICATEACQVYGGLAKERSEHGPNWTAAVDQTAGEVLLYKGAPINAKYSSSNGGRSVKGGQPYLRAIDDPEDAYSPMHRWRSVLSLADVAVALGLPGQIVGLGRSGDQVVVDWHPVDQPVGRLVIAAADFRSRMNGAVAAPPGVPRAVPSIRFTPSFDSASNTVTLDGAGFGHFLGMSQWGAYGKAAKGMKAPDILAVYYAGIRPTKLDPARLPKTIKVAVELGRSEALVGSPARFRIVDGAGKPVAVATSGQWRVVPEGTGVRVVPPPGQDQVPAVQALALDPAQPTTAAPVQLRYRLTTAAVVRVTLTDESGAQMVTSVQPRLVEAGDVTQAVPAPSKPGRYVVTISADSGGGRTAAAPLAVEVHAPPSATATTAKRKAEARLAAARVGGTGPADDLPVRGAGALAAALLLAVLAAAARAVRGTAAA